MSQTDIKTAFKMPVRIFFEKNCIRNHADIFPVLGKKAFIVTGKHSAAACGALDDITSTLDSCNIVWEIFDRIENNPSTETVDQAAGVCRAFGADMVIGIGGGSPLDAAKAVAVLARMPLSAVNLFSTTVTDTLPVIAIPTTAGTGSEVTQYSVLLRKDMQTKQSFGCDLTFPRYALLDARYTSSLNRETTVHTAIDAFTHAFEGFMARRATPLSDMMAREALRVFGECLPVLCSGGDLLPIREKLLYVSLLGGMVISHTGVTLVHGMGYCYTFFHNIPHGKANGLLLRRYLRLLSPTCYGRIAETLILLGYESTGSEGSAVETFCCDIDSLLGKPPVIDESSADRYTQLTMLQKGSIANTPLSVDEQTIRSLWLS
jgi:alcohol dehydrogenase class IV